MDPCMIRNMSGWKNFVIWMCFFNKYVHELVTVDTKLGRRNRLIYINRSLTHHTNKHITVPRNTGLPNQPSIIPNNNKYSNPTNMNWNTANRRPIYPNRTNPNSTVLRTLRSKPNNNKIMRQNNRLKVTLLQTDWRLENITKEVQNFYQLFGAWFFFEF